MAPRAHLAAATAAAALALAGTASAAGIGGAAAFGVSPHAQPDGAARSYYSFELAPGRTIQDAVDVVNGSSRPQALRVSASRGTTAAGSGTGFTGFFRRCTGPACWVHGLPSTVVLPPHGRRSLPFTVTIPPGTPRQQYLAGITVQPAARPAPTTLGASGGARVQATIVHQVNVGVAVTVGDPASLASRLRVEGISATATADRPRLLIAERNTGQTFVHATGAATCQVDAVRVRYPLASDTVLPGDRAVLSANAQGLPSGRSVRCTVTLDYGGHRTTALSSLVKVPAIHPVKLVHTGPGTYSAVTVSHARPTWLVAVVAVAATILLLLAAGAVLLLRGRRSVQTVVISGLPPKPEAR